MKKWLDKFQDGGNVEKYKGVLPVRPTINESTTPRAYYDSRLERINMPMMYGMVPGSDDILEHEAYHALQFKEGRSNFDIAHNTANKQWAMMQKRPQLPTTDEAYYEFHNRKPIEAQMDIQNFKSANKNLQFVPDDLIFDKVIENQMYDNPHSLEGEAQYYQEHGVDFPTHQKYKNRKDGGKFEGYTNQGFNYNGAWGGPAKNGGWLDNYQDGGDIPVSSQGVYDYPEQEVIVPTLDGKITMNQVKYPIFGIDELGNKKLMKPNKDYQFPGKVIHEIPKLKSYEKDRRKNS